MKPRVSIVIATWDRPLHLNVLLHSLVVQTISDWEAIVVHEGGTDTFEGWSEERTGFDPRIRHFAFPQRMNDWGNTCKEWGTIKHARGQFVTQTNEDNYYVPTYFERMLETAQSESADFVYCNMLHNYRGYKILECEVSPGRIDGGGWMAETSLVVATPWPSPKPELMPDGIYAKLLASRAKKVAKQNEVLFVHN